MARKKTTRRKSSNRLPAKYRNMIIFSSVAILLLLFFLSGRRGTIELIRNNHEKERLQQNIEQLKLEKAELDSEHVKLQDDDYIEKVAREEYRMKKKGEKVIKIENPED